MIQDHSTLWNRLSDWLFIRWSDSSSVDGLWIGVFGENENDETLNRLREALLLIKTYDPYRYRRVLRETNRILVVFIPGGAAMWVPALKRCLIDIRFIRSSPPEMVANAIIHEATHGLLFRYGIGYDEKVRERVEKVCRRQEMIFALKLPMSDGLTDLKEWIRHSGEVASDHWTNAALSDRLERDMEEMVAWAEIPPWLAKPLMKYREWRRKRRRS